MPTIWSALLCRPVPALLLLTLSALPVEAQQNSRNRLAPPAAASLPAGFVYLADIDPSIRQAISYFGTDNFVGRRIAGYEAPECILTRQAAEALARVQAELQPSHSLKVYDCYRPTRAVADFAAWARDDEEDGRKAQHFPTVDKRELFRRGFIAQVSGHSRGSAVDLSIIALIDPPAPPDQGVARPCRALTNDIMEAGDWELDFGTSYDCFHAASATASRAIGPTARANRDRLVALMTAAGFRVATLEWWHFQLVDEPFRRAFDFPVRGRR